MNARIKNSSQDIKDIYNGDFWAMTWTLTKQIIYIFAGIAVGSGILPFVTTYIIDLFPFISDNPILRTIAYLVVLLLGLKLLFIGFNFFEYFSEKKKESSPPLMEIID